MAFDNDEGSPGGFLREMRPSTMLVLAVLLAIIFVPMFFIDMSALKRGPEANLQNVPRIDLPAPNTPQPAPPQNQPAPPVNRPAPDGNAPPVVE